MNKHTPVRSHINVRSAISVFRLHQISLNTKRYTLERSLTFVRIVGSVLDAQVVSVSIQECIQERNPIHVNSVGKLSLVLRNFGRTREHTLVKSLMYASIAANVLPKQ